MFCNYFKTKRQIKAVKKITIEEGVVVDKPWVVIAKKYMGEKEVKGSKHNPLILLFHKATSLMAKSDETPWCSSFVNHCLKESGIKGTERANARSFLNWGTEQSSPRIGSIVIFSRGNSNWQGHVGFVVGTTKDYILCLGGNQGDGVSIKKYSKYKVLGYRWPK